MAMSASLRKRVEHFMRKCDFDKFTIEEGEITMYKGDEPFSIREFRRNSETYRVWAELQSDFDSEN